MTLRIASAAVGLPLLSLAILAGASWFSLLTAVAAAIGALELCQMARRRGKRPIAPVAVAGSLGLIAAAHFLSTGPEVLVPLPAFAGVAALSAAVWLLRRPAPGPLLADWGITLSGVLYPGALLFYGPLLRGLEQGRDWVFVLFAVTFATDTAAYYIGKLLGRRPLAPTISPSKTWEGAIGGLLGGAAAGAACTLVFDLEIGLAAGLLLGTLMGVVGQLGDLSESILKRSAGVKDSGRLIPGHGGVLDRADAIVLNLALLYHFVIWAVQ